MAPSLTTAARLARRFLAIAERFLRTPDRNTKHGDDGASRSSKALVFDDLGYGAAHELGELVYRTVRAGINQAEQANFQGQVLALEPDRGQAGGATERNFRHERGRLQGSERAQKSFDGVDLCN